MRGYYLYFDEYLKARSRARTEANFQFIRDVINKYGFPTIEMVGERASKAAFLLCQHADEDLNFQKKVLNLMKNSTGTIRKEHIAYLTDRIMVAEEGLQLYGTQFKSIKDRVFYPIKDSINVDKRRTEMGLNTLSEYLNSFYVPSK